MLLNYFLLVLALCKWRTKYTDPVNGYTAIGVKYLTSKLTDRNRDRASN